MARSGRERAGAVSTLYEQLQLPAVQNVVAAVGKHPQQSAATVVGAFEEQFTELSKMHTTLSYWQVVALVAPPLQSPWDL